MGQSTYIWTGDVDSDWNKAGNWDQSSVPGSGDNVKIRQTSNPYPVISNQDVTVGNIELAEWYSAGELTVTNGKTLTITNGITLNSGGKLFIDSNGGGVDLTGGSFTMSSNGSLIDMEQGEFSSDVDMDIKGNGFYGGSGTVTVNASLTVSNNKTFYAESADVTVAQSATINGTYSGADGYTVFNGSVDVQSGGVINLDTGTIIFNGQVYVGNNGTLTMGTGTVNVNNDLTASSDGNINVANGSLNIQGNATFQSNGNLSIDDGDVNVQGDATLQNGGSFDLNSGSLSVGGDASFTNGGTVNAGSSDIDLKGDLNVPYSGTFNADSSTVKFSGDSEQNITTNGDDITFYNVEVGSESSVNTDGVKENTVIIENNLDVESGGTVEVRDDDSIDIQGDLNDEGGGVSSPRPFIYAINTPDLNTVEVVYNRPVTNASMSTISNYDIENKKSGNSIAINSATVINDSTVALDVSPLTKGVEYKMTVNNVETPGGREISNNHVKRFTALFAITYYSRATGDWDQPGSWSTDSHSGPPASAVPNAQAGEEAVIASGHTITIGSSQDISDLQSLTIKGTGTLTVASGDTLILNQFEIAGAGTFSLESGGTLFIGSDEGIAAAGASKGNIQTATRNYSSSANYVYNGTAPQAAGSGLPQTVRDLRIDNGAGVTSGAHVEVSQTLYLDNGILAFAPGKQLIANTKQIQNGKLRFKRIVDGNKGWRMIGSPLNTTYAELLEGTVTQGYAGAYYDAGVSPNDTLQPNVMYYLESYPGTSNQRWRAPASASSSLQAGRGLNVYFFGDVSADDRYNNALPETLSVTGQEHEGNGNAFDFNVSYTADADTGWNLVANPFAAAIDWDDSGNWTKEKMSESVYVWDPSINDYRTWNGAVGNLNNGLIPPFQAFWVKADTTGASLAVDKDAKTFGGDFRGKRVYPEHPQLVFELSSGTSTSQLYFSFTRQGKCGKDAGDAYCLLPPPGTSSYLQLYSIGKKGNRFSINHLPREFSTTFEIPINIRHRRAGQSGSGQMELKWPEMKQIPGSWGLTLKDRVTGREVDLTESTAYSFIQSSGGQLAKARPDEGTQPGGGYSILAKSSGKKARFTLSITPGADGSGIPQEIGLRQNYPNPFNPATNIRFELPIQNEVSLEVFDLKGRRVATLLKERSFQAGQHTVKWNAAGQSSGVYFYKLTAGGRTIVKKMTFIK